MNTINAGCAVLNLPDIIQRSLACNWRPQRKEDFVITRACALEMFDQLLDDSIQSKRHAADRLPSHVLVRIFEYALARSGHRARVNLRETCRKFRCVIFLSQSLWSDVTTFPTGSTPFMVAQARALWTDTPSRLHLDNSNVSSRARRSKHFPDSYLLATSLGFIRSLIVEHSVADLWFLRTLHRQEFFPELQKLVLSTPDPELWGPMPRAFDDDFPDGLPVIHAPQLREVDLRTVLVHLPASENISLLRLNGRTRGGRYRNPRVWNQWPARMVYSLLARNTTLTVLHLVEVVRPELSEMNRRAISLPSLEILVVCSPSAKEPIWVLENIDFPETTYLGLHIGFKAMTTFDREEFYYTLSDHLSRREFYSLTAVSSMNLSGLLLSPNRREALPLPHFDETTTPLQTTEIAHVLYPEFPGAIDIYLAYQSSWIPDTPWHAIYSEIAPYIDSTDILYVEVNSEFGPQLDNSLVIAADFEFSTTELRLWPFNGCIWVALVKALTGFGPRDDLVYRDISELMLNLYPERQSIMRAVGPNNECNYAERAIANRRFGRMRHQFGATMPDRVEVVARARGAQVGASGQPQHLPPSTKLEQYPPPFPLSLPQTMPGERTVSTSSKKEDKKPYQRPKRDAPKHSANEIIDLSNEPDEPWSPDKMPRVKDAQGGPSRLRRATPADYADPETIVVQDWQIDVVYDLVIAEKKKTAEAAQQLWSARENWKIQKEQRIEAEKKYTDLKKTIDTQNVMDADHVSDILECPFCLGLLDAPWSLTCGCVLCYECIRTSLEAQQKKFRDVDPTRACKHVVGTNSRDGIQFECPLRYDHPKKRLTDCPAPAYTINKLCNAVNTAKGAEVREDKLVYSDPVAAWNSFFVHVG
ncbi:unnamed protein product [Peniophora sp. CBMAI 1063]|nr:unnamed protein product [Peniophora sp. CBMAI 1063]